MLPRILVLGAAGMLGHKLVQVLGKTLPVVAGVREISPAYAEAGLRPSDVVIFDALYPTSLSRAIETAQPDVIVNAVGVIKQSRRAADGAAMVGINALFPHVLARESALRSIRVIHLSTDCVFSGGKGAYLESDVPDAQDLYGRSKLIGELAGPGCLTLRTSMIGRELQGRLALVEWFLGSRGRVNGYRHAIFSGLTTIRLAELIERLILEFPELTGIFQVAADPIDKLSLVSLLKSAYGVAVEIDPDETVRIDRSLDGSRFRAATGFVAPPWPEMIAEMKRDNTPYDAIHAIGGTLVKADT